MSSRVCGHEYYGRDHQCCCPYTLSDGDLSDVSVVCGRSSSILNELCEVAAAPLELCISSRINRDEY